jgi:hypothetical protein
VAKHLINLIVIVEKLYDKIYGLFLQELNDLNIGYKFNHSRIQQMMDIINAIDFIQYAHPSRQEIIKILKHYE